MSSLYMGIAASGRKYNSLADCFLVAQQEDVILIDPMANNAYYDAAVTFPTDKTLFVKADITDDYDHLNLLSDTAYKARLYNIAASYQPAFESCGVNKTNNIVFESLHIDIAGYGMNFGNTPYGNFLFNKCRITMSRVSAYGLLYGMSRGLIEFRNCHLEFLGVSLLTKSMDHGAVVNIIKCTTNNLSAFNEAGTNGNSRLFKIEIKDVVDINSGIENYGINYGKTILANNRPIIAGRILDNGNPVIKPLYLFMKSNQRKVATTISNSEGYFEFDVRNYLTDSLVLATMKNPANSNEYVILNDVKAIDPRS